MTALAHLSPVEQRVIAARLCPLKELRGPAVGAIIGEAPGGRGRHHLPMFPLPPTSAGGRLMAMSGMAPRTYLGRLARRNLFASLPDRWRVAVARRHADELLEWMVGLGLRRAVLCGARVAAAFHVERPFHVKDIGGIRVQYIPHPSGRNIAYNVPAIRLKANDALAWAANLRELAGLEPYPHLHP